MSQSDDVLEIAEAVPGIEGQGGPRLAAVALQSRSASAANATEVSSTSALRHHRYHPGRRATAG